MVVVAVQKSKKNKNRLRILSILCGIITFLFVIPVLSEISINASGYNRNPLPIYDYYFEGPTWGNYYSGQEFFPTNYPIGYGGSIIPANTSQYYGCVLYPNTTSTWLTNGLSGYLIPDRYPERLGAWDDNYGWTSSGGTPNSNHAVLVAGTNYNVAYPNFRYWNGYTNSWVYSPPDDVPISYVEIIIRFYVENGGINNGFFGVYYNSTVDINTNEPWIMTGNHWSGSLELGAGQNTAHGLYNSSMMPWRKSQVFTDWGHWSYRWDITPYYPWTLGMLQSDDIFVMWTSNLNSTTHTQYVDYIGINYIYNLNLMNYTLPTVFGPVDQSLGNRLSASIWLLVLYLPAIALTQFIPKIGFIVGMTLMLIIVSFIYGTSFIPVMVIGLGTMSIIMYKGA